MDMIERVARALAYHNYDTEDVWESHVADARAALEAMRGDPGQDATAAICEPCEDRSTAVGIWNAMIYGILSSSREPKANGSPDSLHSNME